MIIESSVEMAIPRIMQKKDCTLLREEEISSMISKGCEAFLRDLGVPNGTSYVEVEKLYIKSKSTKDNRADLFIDKEVFANFNIRTSSFYHHTWVECKFLRHNKTKWGILNLIADIRKIIFKGLGFSYLIILHHYDLSKHSQSDPEKAGLQNALLNLEEKSVILLFDEKNDLENNRGLPSLEHDRGKVKIKLRRSFSDIFPIHFGKKEELYRFVTIKIHADDYTPLAYGF